MLGYLLGIALIFIGFIALYRFLWVRINDQNYKPVEV